MFVFVRQLSVVLREQVKLLVELRLQLGFALRQEADFLSFPPQTHNFIVSVGYFALQAGNLRFTCAKLALKLFLLLVVIFLHMLYLVLQNLVLSLEIIHQHVALVDILLQLLDPHLLLLALHFRLLAQALLFLQLHQHFAHFLLQQLVGLFVSFSRELDVLVLNLQLFDPLICNRQALLQLIDLREMLGQFNMVEFLLLFLLAYFLQHEVVVVLLHQQEGWVNCLYPVFDPASILRQHPSLNFIFDFRFHTESKNLQLLVFLAQSVRQLQHMGHVGRDTSGDCLFEYRWVSSGMLLVDMVDSRDSTSCSIYQQMRLRQSTPVASSCALAVVSFEGVCIQML